MIKEKIDVCIVDDHQLVRKGIQRILSGYERIGEITEAGNGKELLDLLKGYRPHVVLLDLQMPIMGGVETCEQVHKDYPDIKIVILTMNDAHEMVELLIHSGASGFLSKEATPDEVILAIQEVVDRGIYSNELVFKALQSNLKSEKQSPLSILSKREIEIIRLICNELTMVEISKKLNISERTVHNHRANIMAKLDIHNTAGIVKFAIRYQLISSDG